VIQIGDEDFLVTIRDVTVAGYCRKAARQWFAENGLPWNDFIHPGVSAKLLASYDHAGANRVIEAARKRVRK
jgi:hypothetical protein